MKLYQDMTIAPLVAMAERVPVDSTTKSQAENAIYKLDLNGQKLTFSGSGTALDVKLANFYTPDNHSLLIRLTAGSDGQS